MTGGLPADVVRFVERRFPSIHLVTIYELLSSNAVRTPRVMRSVLFLSNGSLSLLKHFVGRCSHDVAEVLMHAEYMVGIAEEPMAVRDMSLPFHHEANLGAHWENLADDNVAMRRPRRVRCREDANYHGQLVARRFVLGDATYLVAQSQPHRRLVRCYRKQGNVSRVVKLPLVFVLERLAEHIECRDRNPSDFISSVR